MMLKTNPPLLHHYEQVSRQLVPPPPPPSLQHHHDHPPPALVMEECQLPLIDLSDLSSCDEKVRADCAAAICRASSEWGFFQVVNHGIHPELVSKMKEEQAKLFQLPFDKKVNSGLLNNSYRWGTPTATCPKQLSWSEAFHVPLSKISQEDCYGEFTSLRKVMVEFAEAMSKLAGVLAGVLAENLGHSSGNFADICQESSCFLRLNRYPACPMSPEIFRLVPHTDSDFLTILSQDQVGGLQLMKDSRWVAVKPLESTGAKSKKMSRNMVTKSAFQAFELDHEKYRRPCSSSLYKETRTCSEQLRVQSLKHKLLKKKSKSNQYT